MERGRGERERKRGEKEREGRREGEREGGRDTESFIIKLYIISNITVTEIHCSTELDILIGPDNTVL